MFWRKEDTCVNPLGSPDGPKCGRDLRGGAIIVGEDGGRTPLCHLHMNLFFRVLIQAMESYGG